MIKGAVDGSERATVNDLADRMELAQSTHTELVNRVEGVGPIQPSADGRIVHVQLTTEGECRLGRALRTGDDERRALAEMLADLERSQGKGSPSTLRSASPRIRRVGRAVTWPGVRLSCGQVLTMSGGGRNTGPILTGVGSFLRTGA
jgi:DNA-binding MarR family transcriptional regulator